MPKANRFFKRLFVDSDRRRERKYTERVPVYDPPPTTIELPEGLTERSLKPQEAVMSPHKNNQFWYKGQIHVHSKWSDDDGKHNRTEVEQAYADKGYTFISLTGHNTLTPDPGVHGILHIMGAESGNWYRHHLLGLDIGTADVDEDFLDDSCSCEKIQRRIDYLCDRGGFVVLAHPMSGHEHSWARHPVGLCGEGWRLRDLMRNENYHGIEIFNKTLDSRDYWNRLLCSRKRVWGFGVDDFHGSLKQVDRAFILNPITANNTSFNRSWIVVNSNVDKTQAQEDILRQDIIQNIKVGNFYTVLRGSDKTGNEDTAGVGPTDDIGPALHITVSANSITISTDPETDEIKTSKILIVRGKFGPGEISYTHVRFHGDQPRRFTYKLSEWEDWVRFEIMQTRKNEEYLALSQPLFVT